MLIHLTSCVGAAVLELTNSSSPATIILAGCEITALPNGLLRSSCMTEHEADLSRRLTEQEADFSRRLSLLEAKFTPPFAPPPSAPPPPESPPSSPPPSSLPGYKLLLKFNAVKPYPLALSDNQLFENKRSYGLPSDDNYLNPELYTMPFTTGYVTIKAGGHTESDVVHTESGISMGNGATVGELMESMETIQLWKGVYRTGMYLRKTGTSDGIMKSGNWKLQFSINGERGIDPLAQACKPGSMYMDGKESSVFIDSSYTGTNNPYAVCRKPYGSGKAPESGLSGGADLTFSFFVK